MKHILNLLLVILGVFIVLVSYLFSPDIPISLLLIFLLSWYTMLIFLVLEVQLNNKFASLIFFLCMAYSFTYFGMMKVAYSNMKIIWSIFVISGNLFLLFSANIGNVYNIIIYSLGYLLSYINFYDVFSKTDCLIYFLLSFYASVVSIFIIFCKDYHYLKSKDFTNFITHEIRVFLQGINMMLDNLTYNWHELSQVKKQSYLEILKTSLKNLTHLSDTVLNLHNFRQISSNLTLENYDIVGLINEIIIELKPFSLIKGSTINFHYNEEYYFYFDISKIKHVIRNLVSNALKYGNGFDITVEIQKDNEKNLIISVQDYGFGLSDEEKIRVFEQFWTGHKRDAKSCGYGLFLSYSLIQQHKGKMWIEDNYPQGTIFYLSIPSIDSTLYRRKYSYCDSNLVVLDNLNINQLKRLVEIRQEQAKFNILVVDDDLVCLLSLKLILEDLGNNVFSVQSIAHATALLKKQDFDLIFLDVFVNNEKIDHIIEILSYRKHHSWFPIIIIQSGLAYDSFYKQHNNIDMRVIVAYLTKPYGRESIEKLFEMLEKSIIK